MCVSYSVSHKVVLPIRCRLVLHSSFWKHKLNGHVSPIGGYIRYQPEELAPPSFLTQSRFFTNPQHLPRSIFAKSPFEYIPLNIGHQEIRLLTLFPAALDEPIVIKLNHEPFPAVEAFVPEPNFHQSFWGVCRLGGGLMNTWKTESSTVSNMIMALKSPRGVILILNIDLKFQNANPISFAIFGPYMRRFPIHGEQMIL